MCDDKEVVCIFFFNYFFNMNGGVKLFYICCNLNVATIYPKLHKRLRSAYEVAA